MSYDDSRVSRNTLHRLRREQALARTDEENPDYGHELAEEVEQLESIQRIHQSSFDSRRHSPEMASIMDELREKKERQRRRRGENADKGKDSGHTR